MNVCAGINIVDGRVICRCCGDDLAAWAGVYDDEMYEVVTPGGNCWACGLGHCQHGPSFHEYDPDHEAIDDGLLATPCPECGQSGACAWDDEGRALMALCQVGGVECARVVKHGGLLLFKCQNQVVSGAVRWQTREFADAIIKAGDETRERIGTWRLVTEFVKIGGREQPDKGKRQIHPDNNASTLMVLRRVK